MKKSLHLVVFLLLAFVAEAQSNLTITVPASSFCAGSSVSISYSDAFASYQPGNVFSVQLSDASGSFASPATIGQLTGTAAAGVIPVTIPAVMGAGYRMRITSTSPADYGNDNGSDIEILPAPPAPVVSSNSPVCEGETLCFSASGMAGVSYSWVNPQGLNSFSQQNPCIANATPAHSGVYTVWAISGNGCPSLPAYVQVTVNPMPAVNATANSPLCEGQTLELNTTNVPGATYSWSGPSGANPFFSTQRNPTRPNMQPGWAGTHHITVTSAEGCTAEDTVHVQVGPQPSAPVPTLNTALCQGDELCLGPGIWTTPFGPPLTGPVCIPNIQPEHGGTYTTFITVNGCQSPPGTAQVVIRPSPTVQITASDTVINAGEMVTLVAAGTGASSYSWTSPSGGIPVPTLSQIQVSPAATTTYTLVGSNSFGCKDSAFVTIYVTPVSTPEDLQASKNLQLYPNPNNGSFTIELKDCKSGVINIKLTNLLGQEVFAEAASAKNSAFMHQLNVPHLLDGVYLLQVRQGEKMIVKRVVKQK